MAVGMVGIERPWREGRVDTTETLSMQWFMEFA
jgi:hypothetical protein